MMVANKQLNSKTDLFFEKIKKLEYLINSGNKLDETNFVEVVKTIWAAQSDFCEIQNKVNMLGYAEQTALLLKWPDGHKYNWAMWSTFAMTAINEAKLVVNKSKPGYFKG